MRSSPWPLPRANAAAILTDHDRLRVEFLRELELFNEEVDAFNQAQTEFDDARGDIRDFEQAVAAMEGLAFGFDAGADIIEFVSEKADESLPAVAGAAFDPSFIASGLSALTAGTAYNVAKSYSATTQAIAETVRPEITSREFDFEKKLERIGFGPERKRMVWELIQAFDDLYLHQTDVDLALAELGKARQEYQSLLNEGLFIQTEREIFRKRAAAIAQGFRTRDVGFRTFRTEALEQYQTLLDWSAKYAYLAAKAYDYDTGLLGTDEGQAFLNEIVQTRSLGLINDAGEPQFAGSSVGDQGLSGLLKKLSGDWEVVEGRLGFNNPDTQGTAFSLRREHFRLPAATDGDTTWQQRLRTAVVDDLRADLDIAAHALQIEGSEVPIPGIVIEFDTTIADGLNFFGEKLQAGDHAFTASNFATKIHSVGIVHGRLPGHGPLPRLPRLRPRPGT